MEACGLWSYHNLGVGLFSTLEWDGGSLCPGGRRRRGNRACWPLPVTVIAVTGAVKAVTGAVKVVTGVVTAVTRGRDPAPAVTGTVPP